MATSKRIKAFCHEARRMGASDAVIVSPQKVFTATWVRLRCQYGCSEYGQCLTCPPHSPTPETTRRMLDEFRTAILLHGGDWKSLREVGQQLERTVFLAGYYKSFAFLCGPCDLCRTCVAIQQKVRKAAACRHPDQARPAMEAAGIDVFATARAAGLPIEVVRLEQCPQNYYALVLVEWVVPTELKREPLMRLFVPRPAAAMTYRVLIVFAALTAAVALRAAEPRTLATTSEKIALWPGPAPVGDGTFETAHASLTVHQPSPEKANGAAVVICPGGGYGGLVVFPEGHGIAQWLNQHGIAGIVLEYRLPGGKPFVPLLDAQRAVRTVRARAKEWNVDPNRIGIIGFSAGGHLASTAGTHFDGGDPQAADPIDRVSCRPDFMILVYPVTTMNEKTHSGSKANLLGRDPKPELLDLFSNEKQVTAKTPPTFLAHAQDDTVVTPENSRVFFEALQSHQVAAEYLPLPSGGHGLNGYQGPMWNAWQTKSLEWLSKQKMIPRGDKPIRNHTVWTDADGKPISCHDGGISRFGDTFYWYGTSYRGNPTGLWGRKAAHLQNGFNCYSSTNLVDWQYEGVCFEFPRDGGLAGGTSHRPNVLYNDKTRKYVLWFFCIGTTEPEYPAAMLAVATADKPAGPFAFVGQRSTAEEHGWGQDLGLFKDQDGWGYLVYDDGHRNIRVDLLSDDYLSVSGQTAVALKSDGRSKRYEGAALIRYRGKYIVAGSGVEGWNPTDTSYAVGDSPLGPYREMGLMSDQRTWNGQISNFVYIAESDNVFAMCDQWFRGPQGERVSIDESCQLWLPLSFDPATETAEMLPVEQFHPWTRQ